MTLNRSGRNDLKLELSLCLMRFEDLVYVTDKIIIMDYPAAGVEGLYRNHEKNVVRGKVSGYPTSVFCILLMVGCGNILQCTTAGCHRTRNPSGSSYRVTALQKVPSTDASSKVLLMTSG